MEAFIGTILAVGFNYAPKGWMFCNGQILSISQNSALFALLGTMYGGDGINTFALPDLRGRVIVGSQGFGPGVAPVQQGEKSGANFVTVISNGSVSFTLTPANLPGHTHSGAGLSAATAINVATGGGTQTATPEAGGYLCASGAGPGAATIYLPANATPTGTVALNTSVCSSNVSGTTGSAGADTPVSAPVQTTAPMTSIMQPYTGLNYIIAMQGIFPSRN